MLALFNLRALTHGGYQSNQQTTFDLWEILQECNVPEKRKQNGKVSVKVRIWDMKFQAAIYCLSILNGRLITISVGATVQEMNTFLEETLLISS